MNPDVRIIPESEWAREVAVAWAALLAGRPGLRMCLPTGKTPAPVYQEIPRMADFADASIFVLDEFGLPEGDPARCDSMMRRDLLQHLPGPPARFDALDPGATDLGAECARFSREVTAGGLNLTLLGLGRNGHLGLNEPGSTRHSITRKVDLAVATREGLTRYGARSDTSWGLTLGLSELLESEDIWLLVRGEHKAEILAGTLKDPIGASLPATYLREAPNVVVWADEAAASLL